MRSAETVPHGQSFLHCHGRDWQRLLEQVAQQFLEHVLWRLLGHAVDSYVPLAAHERTPLSGMCNLWLSSLRIREHVT